jgi:hypothetical protein
MSMHEYLDRPPAGWFALAVMQKEWRKWDWVALMIDVHPDDLDRTTRHSWVRIPGKHRNKDDRLGRAGKHDRHAALAEPRKGTSHD